MQTSAHVSHKSTNEIPLNTSFFVVFLCMLFGANPVAVKISLTGIGIFTTAGLRFAIASVTLLIWAYFSGKSLKLNTKQLLQMVGLACIFFVQISMFYFGQSKANASHGSLLANLLPFVVMILAHFFLKDDKITKQKITGLIFGFSGVLLLFLDSINLSTDAITGDILLVIAVCIWGCNVIYVKKIIHNFSALQVTVYPMIIALPLYFTAGYFFDGSMVSNLNIAVVQGILYQALVTASFGFVMWNSLIQKYGATTLHSFVFLMPFSGVTLGIVLLDEPVTASLIGSFVFVAAGLLITNWKQKK